MSLQLTGIHHLTAITANAPENLRFYTQTLGMRLVKKTVNQDDTTAYHLFYADGQATPGTDLTFFDWPLEPEGRGTHSISRTGLRVGSRDSLFWWKARFDELKVKSDAVTEIDGRASLDFEDGEGQRFRLIDDGGLSPSHPWDKSPVPAEHQIKGLGPITMSVPDITSTERVLEEVMSMTKVRQYPSPDGIGEVHVFSMGKGGPAAELHVAGQPGLPASRQGRAPSIMSPSERRTRLRCMNGPNGYRVSACRRAARSSATIFARSISASRTVSCSRSQPTAPALRSTNRWRRSAKICLCRRSWSTSVRRLKLG